MFDLVFSGLATSFAAQFGAPFGDAVVSWPGVPAYDAGGSITTPAAPVTATCKAQFDAPTQAMRQSEGFLETDARILVLASTLDGVLDESAKLVIASGANSGTWALLSVTRDPAGIGYECRARKTA